MLVLVASMFSACATGDVLPTDASSGSVFDLRRADVASRSGPPSIEDDFRVIAQTDPDFAGIYLDDELVPVVVSARRALSAEGSFRARARVAAKSGAFSAAAAARQVVACYSWIELDSLREVVRAGIRSSMVPLGVGIDVKENQLLLSTETANAAAARQMLAKAGIPASAYRLRIQDGVTAGASLRDKVRPITGGLMIAASTDGSGYCSMGLQAWKNDENGYMDPSLGRFVLTANHCAPPQGTVTGMQFGQPHRGHGHHLTEVANAEVFYDTARCPYSAYGCQYADVAMLQVVDSVSSTWQRVALSNTANPPAFQGQLSLNVNIWSAVQGQPVRRVGARTGQRNGTVTSPCFDLPTGVTPYVLCTVEVAGYGLDGDSGGPVYTPLTAGYTGSPWPSGIYHHYFTGSPQAYWFSSVGAILYALNGEYRI